MSFGFAALFLATVGLYGVMSFSVAAAAGDWLPHGHGRGAATLSKMVAAARHCGRLAIRRCCWPRPWAAGLGQPPCSCCCFQVRPYDPVIFTNHRGSCLGGTGLVACLVPAAPGVGGGPDGGAQVYQ